MMSAAGEVPATVPAAAAPPAKTAPVVTAAPPQPAKATQGPALESPFEGATLPATYGDKPAMPEKNPKPKERGELRDALNSGKRAPLKAQTIIDFQRFKTVEEQELLEGGKAVGKLSLTNLNPNINVWFLLAVKYADGKKEERLHLENPDPRNQAVSVAHGKNGLAITAAGGAANCDVWSADFQEDVKKARDSGNAFGPVCDGKLYVRVKVDGRKTSKEWVVEFLRENVWGGESITSFVKDNIFKDKFLISSDTQDGSDSAQKHKDDAAGPRNAAIDARFEAQAIEPNQLGITVKREDNKKFLLGRWYENPSNRGVFVSAIIPEKIDGKMLESHLGLVGKLDQVEAAAVDYVVGFDMSKFDIGFAIGTDHPAVGWAARTPADQIDKNVGGPDGFGDWSPLVTSGMINPNLTKSIAAVFTGGFKRDHGAFKWGALASANNGSHYGFVESGVVFSRLNPGLSTLVGYKDGSIDMKTWTEADDARLKDVVFARQNGVPLIQVDEATGESRPGDEVKNWGAGNWSGSSDSRFRTLRAGLCLQENAGKKFLLYGYFSSVTPATMARVFQSYGCKYAMHLDMNALEHTYLSVFPSVGKNVTNEHLVSGMKGVDKSFQDKTIPRFIGFPDNRDFFYLWRK